MVFSFTACSSDGSKVTLNIYNWGDYIDPQVIEEFENEFEIDINYEEFATNEEMLAKIQAGGTAYDVIFPSDYMIESMIKRDLLHPIDFTQMENFDNIGEQFKNLPYDSQQQYSVPYLWGTMGIVYNTTMVDEEVDSWDILWDPAYQGEIIMIDSPRDTIGITLKKLGYSLNSTDPMELEEAKQELMRQKELVRSYEVDTYKGQMIAGEAALALAWSGDAMLIMSENEDLAYAIPSEGNILWFDAMAIPAASEHKEEAQTFIDFMMRPDIAAKNSEYVKYSTPNTAAMEFLPEEETSNEFLYPTVSFDELGEVFTDLGEFNEQYDRAWTEIKSY